MSETGSNPVKWDDDTWARVVIGTVCAADMGAAKLVDDVGAVAALEQILTSRVGVDAQVKSIGWLRSREAAARHFAQLSHPCGVLVPSDERWPAALNDLPVPPVALWWRGHGDISALLKKPVAIVGARAATGYGSRIAATMAADLAAAQWTVISGGAFGIDAAAHRGALTSGPAISVLACGVDISYPVAHHDLFTRIANDGLLLSETGLGQPARRYHFLSRNRIIAALARGTVVVEAAHRSGSLATARVALELGRPVMAVPGPVTSHASAGTHELLRVCPDVHLVTNAQHVREMCAAVGEEMSEIPDGPRGATDALSADAAHVLDRMGKTAADVSEVAQRAHLTVPRALAALAELQLAGLVVVAATGWALTSQGMAPSPR